MKSLLCDSAKLIISRLSLSYGERYVSSMMLILKRCRNLIHNVLLRQGVCVWDSVNQALYNIIVNSLCWFQSKNNLLRYGRLPLVIQHNLIPETKYHKLKYPRNSFFQFGKSNLRIDGIESVWKQIWKISEMFVFK